MDNQPRSRRKRGFSSLVKSFFLGSLAGPLQRENQALADGLRLAMFGPFFGVPVMVNYYSLRLLPYFVAGLPGAKRRYLRERDFFDTIVDD
ncbi:MAG: hypothetical protein KJ621_15245 [Proteobacteria bacterium]|nr:hypothetical protein [Pseudomonadota bacterium]